MVTSRILYLGFLALLSGERLVELGISRSNARFARNESAVEVGRGHFRVMAWLHVFFLVSSGLEVFLFDRPVRAALFYPAFVVALFAQGLRYWVVSTLGRRWNVRIFVWPERPPVTAGPYRFVRHPNYVAVIAEILFVPLIHGAYVTAIVFSLANAALLRVRIRAEERALGASYEAAFARRPRFLPDLYRV
jgi:methyltransferase